MPLEIFPNAIHRLRRELLDGIMLDRGEWQGQYDKPMSRVLETYNVTFHTPVAMNTEAWQAVVEPNLPWAEDHFQERVGGEPLNPGEEYKNWPWYEQGVEEHKNYGLTGKFSHTYMERFWPKFARSGIRGKGGKYGMLQGIRAFYGDLDDLVVLLQERPWTRQAYLPIWFPEDLDAAGGGERVPCTLGYHFQRRPHPDVDSLSITYFMRSCDFFRYLRDDVYMAGRLLQWVVDQVEGVEEGHITMHIANLHIFADERRRLENEWDKERDRRLSDAF